MESEIKANNKYKDSLFKLIFGNEAHKDFTLSLYNALNNSNYSNPDDIVINTLEDAIYIKMKNDVSFILGATMCLYEQQSTFNPNMSYRMLEYVTALYENYITEKNFNKYSCRQFKLPAPRFIVFYNGREELPERSVQKLSELYEEMGSRQLELIVDVYNINKGNNHFLKADCKPLYEYMWFVDQAKELIKGFGRDEEAIGKVVTKLINEMPDTFIIKTILLKEMKEVVGMIFEDFNEELYKQAAIDDAEASYHDGCNDTIQKTIERMFEAKLPLSTISIATGLSEEEIEKIISKFKK